MIRLDARKHDCPMPVIMTKKEIEKGSLPIKVTVDNEIAVKNLNKLAASKKLNTTVTEVGDDFDVVFFEDENSDCGCDINFDTNDDAQWILFIQNESVGSRNNELGRKLMDMMLFTLIEIENRPSHIIFMNGGVLVPTTYEQSKLHLKELADLGVNIMACGTCLNFYEKTLEIGQVSNMYEIIEVLSSDMRVVSV